MSVEDDAACRWFEQADDGTRDGAFAAAALTDETERFSRLEIKAHAIHGLAGGLRRVEHAAAHREVHLEVLDGEEAHGCVQIIKARFKPGVVLITWTSMGMTTPDSLRIKLSSWQSSMATSSSAR